MRAGMKQLLLILAVVMGQSVQAADEEQSLITDVFVEQEIRKQINNPTGELTRADLERVTVFDVRSPRITDASLKDVARLTRLSRLYLNETRITDEGLKELARLKKLTLLQFSECEQLTGTGFRELTALTQLTTLRFYLCTGVTDTGLRELANFNKLS
jgi:hypothetical protein